MSQTKQLFSCIDREGTVYRHWRCWRDEALVFAGRVNGNWELLVDSRGRIVATVAEVDAS